jgi:exodeoxyribonuclease-3
MNKTPCKIVSWNINSIRSKIDHVLEFLKEHDPDILLLQETKCENHQFPHQEFASLPYNISIHGEKSYNGVAIFSKYVIDEVKTDFPGNPCAHQARFIEVTCMMPIGYSRIICVYVPNGGEVDSDKFKMKLDFYDALTSYLKSIQSREENVIIGGDFNVAPFDIDCYDPKALENTTCATLVEKQKFRTILNYGYHDLYRIHAPKMQEFSWWDYRAGAFQRDNGMRIDMILANSLGADKMSDFIMDKSYRAKDKPSDHIPIIAIF